jgi:hypothetical protein
MAEHKKKHKKCKECKEAKAKGIKTKCNCKDAGAGGTRVSVNIDLSGTKEKKEKKNDGTRVPRGGRVFGGQPRVVYTTLTPAQNNLHSMMYPSTPPMYGSYGVSHNATVGGSRPMSIDSQPLVHHEQSTSYSPPGTPMSVEPKDTDPLQLVVRNLEREEDNRAFAILNRPRNRAPSRFYEEESSLDRQRSRSRDRNPLTHSNPVVLDIRDAENMMNNSNPSSPNETTRHFRRWVKEQVAAMLEGAPVGVGTINEFSDRFANDERAYQDYSSWMGTRQDSTHIRNMVNRFMSADPE